MADFYQNGTVTTLAGSELEVRKENVGNIL